VATRAQSLWIILSSLVELAAALIRRINTLVEELEAQEACVAQ
jgi:hypothetical protein